MVKVCRYALHAPLIWSDELASLLFLWLVMLGAVAALARNEHMRLTFLESVVQPIYALLLTMLGSTFLGIVLW